MLWQSDVSVPKKKKEGGISMATKALHSAKASKCASSATYAAASQHLQQKIIS